MPANATDTVTSGVSLVYWYGQRRFLSKRAAYRRLVREAMREATGHERISEDDAEIGVYCRCDACGDVLTGERAAQAVSWLLRYERKATHKTQGASE